jgi:hypothetical protein
VAVRPKAIPAKRYFRGSGILLVIAGALIAGVGIFMAPDMFGRVFAGLMAVILVGGGVYRLRMARSVSDKAVVHETVEGRSVGYVLDKRE